ncbi:hypothetical protein diail_2990 [Diaporthe ilicicola]|nr:hypothetical protein diail_2990 [Diaporthe ilicicola]
MAFNIGQLMTLKELFEHPPTRAAGSERPLNFYDVLQVGPLVDQKTLKQMHRRMALELHPDKVGNSWEATETYATVNEAYETLLNPRRRCEYDKSHGIKGLWRSQACRVAFYQEYKQERQEEEDMRREWWEHKRASAHQTASAESQSKPEAEHRPRMPPFTNAKNSSLPRDPVIMMGSAITQAWSDFVHYWVVFKAMAAHYADK